jgi:putative nucleotidyltransferase with HDIG domain
MRLIEVENLEPGMRVARTVMDSKGRVLLHAGVALTPEYIRGLKTKGYSRLMIKDPEDPENLVIEEDVSPAVRARASAALQDCFTAIEGEVASIKRESQRVILDALESEAISQLMSSSGPLAKVHEVVGLILEDVLTHTTLAGLTSIKNGDTVMFDHSIDVCAVSIMVGHVIGMDYHRLRQLATGSLLHDIGKIFLDSEMTGRKKIVQHTRLGYELLRASEQQDILAPHVAYEHHEHQDGSGLPRGLRSSNEIKRDRNLPPPIPTLLGEVCAVANEYDNLLSGVSLGHPVMPDEALLRIRKDSGTRFNSSIVLALMRVVPVYPVGVPIIIRSERYRNFSGVVIRVNPARLDRPVIVLTHDNRSIKISPEELDLRDEEDLIIKSRL